MANWQGSAPATGTLLRRTVVASGVTYTPGANTTKINARLQAGGGAGGGGATAAVSGAAGGGGASGGFLEVSVAVTAGVALTCAIGASGIAGAAGANPGGAGGDTTLVVGATTYTTKGGPGGTAMAATVTILSALGGAPAAVSTNGDVNTGGEPGQHGFALTGLVGVSGNGASSVLGSGGQGRITHGSGATGLGYGSGGAGGLCLNGGGNVAGGAGLPGVILVDEFA